MPSTALSLPAQTLLPAKVAQETERQESRQVRSTRTNEREDPSTRGILADLRLAGSKKVGVAGGRVVLPQIIHP